MFSLRTLLGIVTISAVYIAGMVYRTEWWQASILTLTYVIYAAAISAAILAKQHRAFFVVFVVFGVAYGVCRHFEAKMLPQKVFERVGFQLHEQTPEPIQDPFGNSVPGGSPYASYIEGYAQLLSVGHSFFALLISLVAGVIAEAMVRKSRSKNGSSGSA